MLAGNLTGRQIGDFVLEDRIGRGGMAVVYRAMQVSVNRSVAVKLVPLDIDDEQRDEFSTRFDLETRLIASLEHIHILPVYAYGLVDNEYAYLAMRLMRGGTLVDLLRHGPLSLEQAIGMFTQIGRALQYAHDRGVIHRDLKPSNILLDEAGNAYLSDFGLAKMVEKALDITRSGNLVGTPAYVAPELVRGMAADERSDIYSLGVILYHMLAGRPPFELSESGLMSLLYKHVEKEPPPLHELKPDIPPAVEVVVMQALRKNPEERFHSVEAMVLELNNVVGRRISTSSYHAIPIDYTSTPLRVFRRMSHSRRRWWLLALISIVIIAAAAIILPQALRRPPPVATIMPGERGTIETLTPSDAEIAMARTQLGENGFIVYIACTLDDNFQSGRAVDLEEIANEHNLTYRVYDSENDAYTQINRIDQARLDGARAFILCPLSTDALEPSIDSLQEAHIPLVITTLYDHPYGVKLDSDSYAVGLRIGSYAAHIIDDKWQGQANVLLLGRPGFPASENRFAGIEDAIRDIFPDVNILARDQGVTREDAYATVRRFLQEGTTINVITSVNDAGAIGAVDALEEAGIAPEAVDIISSNAEPATVELIRNGMYIRGSVAINREQSARLAIYGVIKQLAGSTVPEYFAFEPGDMITVEVLEAEDGE